MADTETKEAAADAPAEPEITDPGTTLGTPTPADSGITDPGTTLGLPVEEEPKQTRRAEKEST